MRMSWTGEGVALVPGGPVDPAGPVAPVGPLTQTRRSRLSFGPRNLLGAWRQTNDERFLAAVAPCPVAMAAPVTPVASSAAPGARPELVADRLLDPALPHPPSHHL